MAVKFKNKESNKYTVIGLMSGTSLDGVDIACCSFSKNDSGWSFQLLQAETLPYTTFWKKRLSNAHTLNSEALIELHSSYGQFLGALVHMFIKKHDLKKVDFLSSHGHTIFHQPSKKFTFQLGDGNALHHASGLPVVFDFRSLDVARGGQGAPLVPIGDKLLFGEYDVCINLGGIANLSMDVKGKRIAYDVCYANMGLNYLAQQVNKTYDRNGALAEQGEVNIPLLQALTKKYQSLRTARPSLGREGFEKFIQPLLSNKSISVNDRLRTFTESIVTEIAYAISTKKGNHVLLTGGGAFNNFLLYRLIEQVGDENFLVLPDEKVIKFKEALVFAFLGVLRVRSDVNTLASATQAQRNSSSGVMVGF
jgi:anhydro-N-acetylmuramic acid kinase